ncbi:hypothetical protein GCM10010974_14880 [Brevibacterium sediminis]|uniref:Uncharacterized protein n=1 Tax=Brevibacterium sediminis TaxID=1857024 RepID=A0ABQ1M2Q2_9MICO|nr:hypothetical protein GCM10010974_14880 [Brevibacterium sediminis]
MPRESFAFWRLLILAFGVAVAAGTAGPVWRPSSLAVGTDMVVLRKAVAGVSAGVRAVSVGWDSGRLVELSRTGGPLQ